MYFIQRNYLPLYKSLHNIILIDGQRNNNILYVYMPTKSVQKETVLLKEHINKYVKVKKKVDDRKKEIVKWII